MNAWFSPEATHEEKIDKTIVIVPCPACWTGVPQILAAFGAASRVLLTFAEVFLL